jgi:hypothetical protein
MSCVSRRNCLRVGGREEREQRRADIEHLASSLVNKVNECVGAIDEGECRSRAAAAAVSNCYSLPCVVDLPSSAYAGKFTACCWCCYTTQGPTTCMHVEAASY